MRVETKDQYVVQLASGKFMDLDSSSGGYPYETELRRAKVFLTLDSARAQANYYKEPGAAKVMQIVAVELEDCTPRINDLNQYEAELAALKQRFGVK